MAPVASWPNWPAREIRVVVGERGTREMWEKVWGKVRLGFAGGERGEGGGMARFWHVTLTSFPQSP